MLDEQVIETKKEIVPIKILDSMVMPAVSVEEAKKNWKAYQDLKTAVVEESDVQIINGKKFLKKSYWRKIARFFNLSVEIVDERKEEIGEGKYAYHFKARATATNGAYAEGVGSCDNYEKGRSNSVHNTRTTAETRAWNRAVSNLVGGGEISAEEVVDNEVENEDDTPICPNCQSEMYVSRYNKDPKTIEYYCSKYKTGCRGTIIVDKESGLVIGAEKPNTNSEDAKNRQAKIDVMKMIVKKEGFTAKEMTGIIKTKFGKEKSDDLTMEELDKLIEFIGRSGATA